MKKEQMETRIGILTVSLILAGILIITLATGLTIHIHKTDNYGFEVEPQCLETRIETESTIASYEPLVVIEKTKTYCTKAGYHYVNDSVDYMIDSKEATFTGSNVTLDSIGDECLYVGVRVIIRSDIYESKDRSPGVTDEMAGLAGKTAIITYADDWDHECLYHLDISGDWWSNWMFLGYAADEVDEG